MVVGDSQGRPDAQNETAEIREKRNSAFQKGRIGNDISLYWHRTSQTLSLISDWCKVTDSIFPYGPDIRRSRAFRRLHVKSIFHGQPTQIVHSVWHGMKQSTRRVSAQLCLPTVPKMAHPRGHCMILVLFSTKRSGHDVKSGWTYCTVIIWDYNPAKPRHFWFSSSDEPRVLTRKVFNNQRATSSRDPKLVRKWYYYLL